MNEVEKFKKERKDKNSKKDLNIVLNIYTDAIGDLYARNRMTNDMWRKYAEENKVTGLKSFIHELELRWKATPGLGGKPESPNVPLTNPIGLSYILELLNNKSKNK